MRWFALLGVVGLAGVAAELLFPRFPDALFLVAAIACAVATYGVMIVRGRRRGEDVVTTLTIQYGERLGVVTRVVFVALGAAVLALMLEEPFAPSSLGYLALGGYVIYLGVTGTSPNRIGRKRDSERDAG